MSVEEIAFDEHELPSAEQRRVISGVAHSKCLVKDQLNTGSATEVHSFLQQPDSDCESKQNAPLQCPEGWTTDQEPNRTEAEKGRRLLSSYVKGRHLVSGAEGRADVGKPRDARYAGP